MTPAEIKQARSDLGLSASQMGDLMETSRSVIFEIEAGTRPPPARFVALLRFIQNATQPDASSAAE